MAMSPHPNPFPEGEGTVRRRSVISHAIAIPLSLQGEGFPATASTTRTVPLFSLSLQGAVQVPWSGHSQAAPRTPLESPCNALRIGVSHSPPKTHCFTRSGTV